MLPVCEKKNWQKLFVVFGMGVILMVWGSQLFSIFFLMFMFQWIWTTVLSEKVHSLGDSLIKQIELWLQIIVVFDYKEIGCCML
jgi:hypothetical protein